MTLRKIETGGLDLDGVKASVVKGLSAPLLLGQPVLARIGRIEMDNSARVLRITCRIRK